jgi:hypothetical protein
MASQFTGADPTVIVKLHAEALPLASVAVTVTVVVPLRKLDPGWCE